MDPELARVAFSIPTLAVLGLCIGSFLNVVIHRVPLMLERGWRRDSAEMLDVKIDETAPITLSTPASRCPSCGHRIAWYENIPVLSYAWLRGRCSACKTRISARYPVIEIATGLLFAAVGWQIGAQPQALLWCGFIATLIALAGIDWDTTLLPDSINQPLLWAGFIAALMNWTLPLSASVLGALAGYLSLWSVATLFKLVMRKEGMGEGDFKLLAALGAWLGWQMILPIVLAASLVGAVVGISMKFMSTLREGRYVPFGPFLAGGGLLVLFAGQARVLGWLGW